MVRLLGLPTLRRYWEVVSTQSSLNQRAPGRGRLTLRRRQPPPDPDEQRARREEAEVPQQLIGMPRANVMQAEDLMVDQALDEVEQAPAGEHRRPECATIPRLPLTARTKQQHDTDERHDPDEGVEVAVLDILLLKVLDRRGLAGRGLADQVVPTQDLVKDDPVDESAEADAKRESCLGQG